MKINERKTENETKTTLCILNIWFEGKNEQQIRTSWAILLSPRTIIIFVKTKIRSPTKKDEKRFDNSSNNKKLNKLYEQIDNKNHKISEKCKTKNKFTVMKTTTTTKTYIIKLNINNIG